MFLAGDIGGTKTNLAIYAYQDGVLEVQKFASFPSAGHASLAELVRVFLGAESTIRHACFGVAGPVKGGRVQVTNLPWVVDAAGLQAELGFQQVSLLNDLEANAYGIATLRPSELVSINPEADLMQLGNRALIAAGTGLGEAGLMWDGVVHRPFSSEGGHASFAPNDAVGDELLVFLRQERGHVSWERVLSGMGMRNLYRFFPAAFRPARTGVAGGGVAHGRSSGGGDGGGADEARSGVRGRGRLLHAQLRGRGGQSGFEDAGAGRHLHRRRHCAENDGEDAECHFPRRVSPQRSAQPVTALDTGLRDFERQDGATRRGLVCRAFGLRQRI